MASYILELKDVVKTFGGVIALNGAQFQLKKGEVHALMGENGAGKSTFIKVITGVHKPDSGTILLDNKEVAFKSTVDSEKLGIAAIYQHVTAFPDLSVTENIFMGREITTKFHTYDWKAMRKRAKEIIAPLSDKIDVSKPMNTLSVAQQQLVEIAKALSREARILIMDEPTASLTKYECEELYKIVDRLRDQGVSIIFITHKFEDMYRVATRVTVLRDSKYIGSWDVDKIKIVDRLRDQGVSIIFITHKFEDMYRVATRVTVLRDSKYIGSWDVDKIANHDLITAMVGRELDQMYPNKTSKVGDVVLEVKDISKEGYYKNVSFNAKKGEILALTGLVGAGRTEVCQSLFGILAPDSGEILLDKKSIKIKSPIDALKLGIGLLPEDRQVQGLINELPIYQNVTSPVLNNFVKKGVVAVDDEMNKSIELCEKIQLKAKDIEATPASLSGGNQQKVVFAKLLNCDLKVLILDEPTKGIDVGAKYSIYEIMNELASNGYTIIMVSSEMPEVLGMADRIVVMSSGRVTDSFSIKEATQGRILEASLMKKTSEVKGE